MTIAEVIKSHRAYVGLSQAKLADKLGVSREIVAYWETGKRSPSGESILKLMAVLNIPPEAFDEYKEAKRQ